MIGPSGAGVRGGSPTTSSNGESDEDLLEGGGLAGREDEDADLAAALEAAELEADDVNDSEADIEERRPERPRRRRRLVADSWPLSAAQTHNIEVRFDGHTAGRQVRRRAGLAFGDDATFKAPGAVRVYGEINAINVSNSDA